MSTRAPAVEARQLIKTYPGDVTALNGMDLSVGAGTVFGLLGPNGAGKSTTVKILTTLARPDSGAATVAGHDVLRHPDRVRRAIGVVAQKSGADPVATGRENLLLQGRLYGMRGAAIQRRADELLDRFDLAGAAKRQVKGTPAACNAASTWRSVWSTGPRCSSSTSPPPDSTPRHGRPCGTRSPGWPATRASRSCSPRTTWRRPTGSPNASRSSTAAGSSSRAPPTSSRVNSGATPSTWSCAPTATVRRSPPPSPDCPGCTRCRPTGAG